MPRMGSVESPDSLPPNRTGGRLQVPRSNRIGTKSTITLVLAIAANIALNLALASGFSTAAATSAVNDIVSPLFDASAPTTGDLDPLFGGTETAETEATEVAAPLEGDTDGNGDLSQSERNARAKYATREYTLNNGTVITVDPKQALPAAVIAEFTAEFGAAMDVVMSTEDDEAQAVAIDATFALADSMAAQTGKGVMFVMSGSYGEWISTASGSNHAPFAASTDKAGLVADVTQWAAARGFQVIVL